MLGDQVRLWGEGVVLREWTGADLPQMTRVFDDPEIAYRTPTVSPFGEEASRAYLEAAYQAKAAGTRLHLAITAGDDLPRGEAILNLVTACIAYVVGAPYRGQGLARRAMGPLLSYAYDVVGLSQTYLEIEADNVGSASVARSTGFRPISQSYSVEDKGRRYVLHRWVHEKAR